MKLLLDEGPYMLKFIFALFLIVIFTFTGFFTFSYFATGEYGGTGVIYTAIPFLSLRKPSLMSLSSVYLLVSILSVNRYILKIADINFI